MNVQITAIPSKPATVAGNLAKLPDAFKPYLSQRIWVCWRWTWNAKKQGWDKPPLDPKGFNASSTNAARWFTYEDALSAVQAGVVDGIGINVYGLTNSEIVLDLDDCRDPLTGTVAPWAQEIVDQAASYAEVTPSGTGLRVIGHGNVGKQHRRFSNVDGNGGGLEIYTAGEGRYITVSGADLPGCWPLLSDISEVATRLLEGKGKLHPEQPSLEPGPKAFDPAPAYQPGAIMSALGLNRAADLDQLIRNGAPEGKRSEQFHHAIGLAKREGWTQENLERLMRANPSGIASKYLSPQDRLSAEIGRCWGKVEGPAADGRKPIKLQFFSAAELGEMTFAPIKWVVPGYIPEGCSLLAGRPKLGKSWLVLDIALAVARGSICLGDAECEQGEVLYLALEDNKRRLQSRIRKVSPPLCKDAFPRGLTFATEWPRCDNGGLDQIRAWLQQAKSPRLVAVDVLAQFRPSKTKEESVYEADYRAIKGLQELASEFGVAVIVVHHTRKGTSDVDPFEQISGTLGLSGAADAAIVLDRTAEGCTLYGRGRDIEEYEKAITFDKDCCRWTVQGDASEVHRSDERGRILAALDEEGAPMSPSEIATVTGMKSGNTRRLLLSMGRAGDVKKAGYGKYTRNDRPTHTVGNTGNSNSVGGGEC